MVFFLLKMAFKNAVRHRLRAMLTLSGIVVAILAFGLLRTVVGAWYAGADAASDKRLITRSSISLVFSLPIAYGERIRQVPGVSSVSWANWFGGVYIEEKNFFPQFAVDPVTYLPLYPEFVLDEASQKAFIRDRRGAMVGRKLAQRFGWKVGDVVTLRGTIFPGSWSFVVRGIYKGRNQSTDENQFLFHWDYLNEKIRTVAPRYADRTGVFVVGIQDGSAAAEISQQVDALFKNSLAETLTETEKAFQLGFVAMTEVIVQAIEIVSFVVILIIMAVMANTMAMSARERTAEYATLKALGFQPMSVGSLIFAESMVLGLAGGAMGIVLTYPAVRAIGGALDNIFPIFNVADKTVWMQLGASLVIGLSAACVPSIRAMRVRIVDGLRAIA
ncbi:ABC transporter permease [Parachitinimonas caeni]|uniref:ABC transporter permease n=1 Tax=Parachitinimonas caeni TaxID=3031301 RepID=A0ABT7DTV4_9NEIS|nr:ABC transporter permease [Parachitinimonas caeni]MDK2123511.1 ABC transporter permease [Parachitinimonas caeni]